MKKTLGTAVFLLVALNCFAWQLRCPLGGSGSSPDTGRKPTRVTSRTLTGVVLGKSDAPVSNAVVYLKEHEVAGGENRYRRQ